MRPTPCPISVSRGGGGPCAGQALRPDAKHSRPGVWSSGHPHDEQEQQEEEEEQGEEQEEEEQGEAEKEEEAQGEEEQGEEEEQEEQEEQGEEVPAEGEALPRLPPARWGGDYASRPLEGAPRSRPRERPPPP